MLLLNAKVPFLDEHSIEVGQNRDRIETVSNAEKPECAAKRHDMDDRLRWSRGERRTSPMLPYPSQRAETVVAVFCFRQNTMVRRKQQCWTCSWCQHGSEQAVSSAAFAMACPALKPSPVPVRLPSERPRAA